MSIVSPILYFSANSPKLNPIASIILSFFFNDSFKCLFSDSVLIPLISTFLYIIIGSGFSSPNGSNDFNSLIFSISKSSIVKISSIYISFSNFDISKFSSIYLVISFLRNLDEKIVLQRLLGRVPEENSLFCNWSTSWWKIRDEILEKMERNNFKQGDLFNNFEGVVKK